MQHKRFHKWLAATFGGLTFEALLAKAGVVIGGGGGSSEIEGADGNIVVIESNAGVDSGFGISDADLETFDSVALVPTQNAVRELVDGRLPYKTYVALLNQTGTDAPVATVLQNSLGAPVVWTRAEAGLYIGTLTGAFTVGKTFVMIPQMQPDTLAYISQEGNANAIDVLTKFADLNTPEVTSSDGRLTNTPVEIRVYP